MLIWRPPAALILFGSFAVLFLGSGFLLVNVLELMPPGDRAGAVSAWIWGVGIAASDLWYRRSSNLSLVDLTASTVFFVVPTWIVGIAIVIFGAQLWSNS